MASEGDISQAQLSASETRRQRSDKISKVMSENLLRGHRMLASYCAVCSAILMEDKAGRQYCIGCEQVDAAGGQPPTNEPKRDETEAVLALDEAKHAVVEKLRAATKRLALEDAPGPCVECATMIKVYAETVTAIEAASAVTRPKE